MTINKACLPGINAIALAGQLIRAGEHEVIVAGGMESMTQAPHLFTQARTGIRLGDVTLVDSLYRDGLSDPLTGVSMGSVAEQTNTVDRQDQDRFAAASHSKAHAAWEIGLFDEEVIPITLTHRGGGSTTIRVDEGIRPDTTPESLGAMKQAFTTTERSPRGLPPRFLKAHVRSC